MAINDISQYCCTMDYSTPIFLNIKTITCDSTKVFFPTAIHKSGFKAACQNKKTTNLVTKRFTHNSRLHAVDGISDVAFDPAQVEITWEIVLGALAGVTPFVVAGIEFNKRIVEQRQCKVCKGSGLVLRDNKYYFRCPACGGFLPWQSWKRFFTG